MLRKKPTSFRWPGSAWLASGFIIFVFLAGGGSRADIASLVVLRPLAIVVLFLALTKLSRATVVQHRFLFIMASAITLLAALQVLPLPPAAWRALPGRELVAAIDDTAELGMLWRPLALIPAGAWNAFFSLFVPLAALVVCSRLSSRGHERLAIALIVIGTLHVAFGILQLAGPRGGPLYFYRVTNDGALVGLFSNRNHGAMFVACLFPLLGYLAGRPARDLPHAQLRIGLLSVCGLLFLGSLFLAGSRAGLVVGLAGIVGAVPLLRLPQLSRRTHRSRAEVPAGTLTRARWIALGLALGCGLLLSVSDAPSLQRLFATDSVSELRVQIFKPLLSVAWSYFPVGSGFGSFAEVYQIGEPLNLLQDNYVNHAHNDWLEILITGGLPAVALVAAAVWAWARASWRVFVHCRGTGDVLVLGRTGSIIIALLAVSSFVDYPLRTPSLACLFVISSVWLSRAQQAGRKGMQENGVD